MIEYSRIVAEPHSHSYVKVLDFGLAKLTEQQNHRSDPEAATMVKTEPGVVMGTVSYMSPEQARGQEVDAGRAAYLVPRDNRMMCSLH